MALPWISDPTVDDYRDVAASEFEAAIAAVQATYPDAHLTEVVPGSPHLYTIEAEHEDHLLRFADADTGHLHCGDPVTVWECVVTDEDGDDVMRETGADLGALTRDVYGEVCARVDTDRVEQANDPDRDHDSREL